MASVSTLRQLVSELRKVLQNPKIQDTLPVTYLFNQYKNNKTTSEQLCKAREEMLFKANTYLCYLRSQRLSLQIQKTFQGKGERSIQETADMVGFKLPHDPMK